MKTNFDESLHKGQEAFNCSELLNEKQTTQAKEDDNKRSTQRISSSQKDLLRKIFSEVQITTIKKLKLIVGEEILIELCEIIGIKQDPTKGLKGMLQQLESKFRNLEEYTEMMKMMKL